MLIASSAVGSAFVQIAKNVVGCAKVVGVAGGKEKCDWVKKLGADECLDYKVGDTSKRGEVPQPVAPISGDVRRPRYCREHTR
jgi:NADPH-dependent curcumin reductase CurA